MVRRTLSFLLATVMTLLLILPGGAAAAGDTPLTPENTPYSVPVSPNVDYNMNVDWKYMWSDYQYDQKNTGSTPVADTIANQKDSAGRAFYEKDYDDSAWDTVSVPHTPSSGKLFDEHAANAGDGGVRGIALYRKHFTVGQEHQGKKFLLEFEGIRQGAYVWVNGTFVGYYEAGVDPFGMDISSAVVCGQENVIALINDGSSNRGMAVHLQETRPGSEVGSRDGADFQWNTNEFNPTVMGLTRDVILHVKNDVYQTLPLYSNLKTTGAYVYADEFNIGAKTANITVEAEVRNESSEAADLSLEVAVVDMNGTLQYRFGSAVAVNVPVAQDKGTRFDTVVPSDAYADSPASTSTETVEVSKITASAKVGDLHFWSTRDPYLYKVYSILKSGDQVLDVTEITTGFRKVEARGGSNGGIFINDERVWLTGYAQRSTDEWAPIAAATDWLHDDDMALIRESNANFVRWMHIAAQPAAIRSADKYGVACVQLAGDKETDMTGRVWNQRVEVMRDTIIYF